MLNILSHFLKDETTIAINPVYSELNKLKHLLKKYPYDMYVHKAHSYMSYAASLGLDGEHIVASCYDLALTKDEFLWAAEQTKAFLWNELRFSALKTERAARLIDMKLYPIYFSAILKGIKQFEGRAFDPTSDKNYPDIRKDDQILFTVDPNAPDIESECKFYDLDQKQRMQLTVSEIYHSSTVHGMYQYCPCVGNEFQPMINGPSELLQLQRAAVYYTLPDYPRKIAAHGFIGIKLENPRII